MSMAAGMLLPATSAFAQDWAKARLEKSPRHHEEVKIKQGERDVQSFLVFPEVKEKATAVLVIHEIFGLTDWVRGVADQLAEASQVRLELLLPILLLSQRGLQLAEALVRARGDRGRNQGGNPAGHAQHERDRPAVVVAPGAMP